MPPEPKQPIEELLEASAKKRRTEFGADPSMPNPMRARLQEEIAALTGRAAVAQTRRFRWSWPKLALGTAFACLLIGGAGLLWIWQEKPSESARLARSNRLELAAAADGPKLASASAPAEARAKAADETKPAAQAFQSVAPSANLTQQFSQVATDNAITSRATSQKASKVLDNFQVEQNGRNFRIVDEDGSTYTGRIEEQTLGENRDLLKTTKAETESALAPAPLVSKVSSPNNELHFRATGYSDRLKKKLVFEGSYILEASPARKDLRATAEEKQTTPQQSARILGTAKIEGEPPIQVDAVTVPLK